MKHILNQTVIISIITIFFIWGRVVYLWNVEKPFSLNKKRTIRLIRKDPFLLMVISIAIALIALDLIQYILQEKYISSLIIGLLWIAGLLLLFRKMKRDEIIKAKIINDWKKTHLIIKLYLISLGLFTTYIFFESIIELLNI